MVVPVRRLRRMPVGLIWAAACAAAVPAMRPAAAEQPYRAEDFVGKRLGIMTGTVYDAVMEKEIPGAIPVFFNTKSDAYEALARGKVDGVLDNIVSASRHAMRMPDIKVLEPWVLEVECGIIMGKDNDRLRRDLNAFIAEIRADGTYDDMLGRWLGTDQNPAMPSIEPGREGPALRFGSGGSIDGFSYIMDGEAVGFDIEFARRFAARHNRTLDVVIMDFGGLVPAVHSGKLDFAANLIIITEERLKTVGFTDAYYPSGSVVSVRDPKRARAAGPFWTEVMNSLERNIVAERRWLILLRGLGVTMLIAVSAFVLGIAGGAVVCALATAGGRWARRLAGAYVALLRGTPEVVLLMILYFVVFARSSASPVAVAILAFALNAAAYLGEIFRTALLAADAGQAEAARAMGFGHWGAFRLATLPQVIRTAAPLCQGQFVSLFKMTAVVGYVAVVDLTKAGDVIRARTYDAFAPLLIVALVYLLVIGACVWLFGRLGAAIGGGDAAETGATT